MELKLSIIFTTILLIFFLCLSVHAAMTRRKSKIPLGEEKNENLIRAVRAHGNFLEYTPLFIISFIMLEFLLADTKYLIGVAAFFLLGRFFHAYSMFAKKGLFRMLGMMLTFIPYIGNIAYLVVNYI
jgi:uncharacterized membrane protein YecN with MAPEG domain